MSSSQTYEIIKHRCYLQQLSVVFKTILAYLMLSCPICHHIFVFIVFALSCHPLFNSSHIHAHFLFPLHTQPLCP